MVRYRYGTRAYGGVKGRPACARLVVREVAKRCISINVVGHTTYYLLWPSLSAIWESKEMLYISFPSLDF